MPPSSGSCASSTRGRRALADGTGTLEQVTAAAAARLVAAKDPASPYRLIFDKARTYATHDLRQAYAEHGDAWITDALRPAIHKAAATLIRECQYALAYDAFREPRAADNWLRNRKASEAWDKLRDLYRAARTVRKHKVIPSTFKQDDTYEWTGEGEYTTQKAGDTLYASIRENIQDGNLTWFPMAVQYGLKPTLLTESETAK